MTATRKCKDLVCAICGSHLNVQLHHIGGRRHLIWVTAPLCQRHHDQLHKLITTAGIDLEYTSNPVERLIRASKAISIFMCMVLNALDEARPTKPNN